MDKTITFIKIVKKKGVIMPLVAWVVLCFVTIFVFYNNLQNFMWIDIPTHFAAGAMISAIVLKVKTNNPKKIFFYSFLVFLGWEFFEIFTAMSSQNIFIINIFQETIANRVQDVFMDVIGFAFYIFIYRKYHTKQKIHI